MFCRWGKGPRRRTHSASAVFPSCLGASHPAGPGLLLPMDTYSSPVRCSKWCSATFSSSLLWGPPGDVTHLPHPSQSTGYGPHLCLCHFLFASHPTVPRLQGPRDPVWQRRHKTLLIVSWLAVGSEGAGHTETTGASGRGDIP